MALWPVFRVYIIKYTCSRQYINQSSSLSKRFNGLHHPRNHSSCALSCGYNLKNNKDDEFKHLWSHSTRNEDRCPLKLLNQTQTRQFNSVGVDDILTVSVSHMKKILRLYGITFDDGFTCLIALCPLCTEKNKNTPPSKVYINKTTGYFICNQCQHSGPWTVLETLLSRKKTGKPITAKELEILKERSTVEQAVVLEWKKIRKFTEPLSSLPEDEIETVLKDLKFSLPSMIPVIGQFEIRIDLPKQKLYLPLYGCDGQAVGYKVMERETGMETTYPSTGCTGIIAPKQGKMTKSDVAIVVPSLLDAFSLAAHKTPCQIVCLPHGLTSLPLQMLPCLERFKKLILWFGNDIDSWDTARNFAKKLDERRCYFVRPTEDQPSSHAAHCGGQDLKAIVAAAQPIWHEAITEFSSLRQDVLAELQNNDKVQGVKWKRFPYLSKTLKGHRRGEFTVLTGPTGSGKTTFMSEYSLDLATQGVKTLWGSFEIRNARLARTMLTQMAGIPLEKNLNQFDTLADEFEKLPIYFMMFHGQQSVKVVMEAVEHATYVHDIAHVIIDNVQFMMGVSEESKHMDRFWKQDAIIANFRTFATNKNCHVSLVIHPRKEREAEDLTTNSIFGGAKAAQEADNVLIIQDKRLTSVRGKKYLQIAKNRYSGDLGIMYLDFDKDSISYGNRKKKIATEVKNESSA